ncbi:unnamed protein product [Diamesa tonsa]
MTPPSTPSPLKKRYRELENENIVVLAEKSQPKKSAKIPPPSPAVVKERKSKVNRKLKFDEDKTSPVSGTIIRTLEEINENDEIMESGDIEEIYNVVEVTDEAKAELAEIPNIIGAYLCKLCRIEFDDAFGLARHRCNCIVLLEYRCPECGKKFNCPANLASHRRWHKPRDQVVKKSDSSENDPSFPCKECGKSFKRQAYLKKHLTTHNKKPNTATTTAKKPLSHNDSSSASSTFNVNSNHSHGSNEEVLIPQPVFNFNRISTPSPSHYSDSEHELVINENSSSSINSNASTTSAATKFNLMSQRFTEDENIAISALANLRSGASVIRHTLTV